MQFEEKDIYIISYINRKDDNIYEDEITIIGEENALKMFDFACDLQEHDEIVLYKGKIVKVLNCCVVADTEIKRVRKNEK